jgi:type I restriction enzyme M protein
MSLLVEILRDSNYGLSLFSDDELQELESRIIEKESKGQKKYFINCIIRDKEIQLKPEEVVRQLYTSRLIKEYGYPKSRIKFEHAIHFGREVKSADMVVFDKDRPTVEYIIVEVKKPKLLDGKKQLNSYCNATGAPIGVWSNGGQISQYNRKDPNYFEDLTDIPNIDQTLEDVIRKRFTLKDLIIKDKIPNEGKSLKDIILELEEDVLANAGVDVFEEVFKLIFTKLFDELKSKNNKVLLDAYLDNAISSDEKGDYEKVKEALQNLNDTKFRLMEFRNTGQSDSDLKKKIQTLFDEAKEKWHGVFPTDSKIDLSPSHLSICISGLQDVKLFNSNLQVIDEAFEYLVSKSSRGEKGQYFTPRTKGAVKVRRVADEKCDTWLRFRTTP